MNTFLRFILVASVVFAMSGCGAKGPLILPEKAAPIEVPADEPTDDTPQVDAPQVDAPQVDAAAPTPADEQAEDAVEDPAPSTPDR